MFDHLEFSVENINDARRFYVPICKAIGAHEVFFDADSGELGIGSDNSVNFLLTEGKLTTPKLHICFKALSKESVETAYLGALSGGGSCNGKPGYRDHYAAGYFAAFIIDPDGHNVEILFREPSNIAGGA